MKRVSAFCPAGISSFFQAVTSDKPPRSIEAACRIGARGGGFVLEKGVYTTVEVIPSKTGEITITINGKDAPEAKVTREICTMLMNEVEMSYSVSVSHRVEVPIGAGYGASAAGALSTGLALAKALKLRYTMNQIAQFAHTAEIRCATGLGSISGVLRGGAILILEPGAPGYDRVDWLPIEPSHRIITASYAPIPKENIIFSKEKLRAVNQEAQKVLNQLLRKPDLELFLNLCYNFAQKAGFLSKRIRQVIGVVKAAGAIGATQNQIGDSFHALTYRDKINDITSALSPFFSSQEIIVSKISLAGPRYT